LVGRKVPSTYAEYEWMIQDMVDTDKYVYVTSNNQIWGYDEQNQWVTMGSVERL
jgi:hypothetical protein